MKKKNKGFTIVELVIVIAVIAILAAVLIPTFSSLIKRANLSSDQVAVRNMNNALAMDEAVNGKPVDLLDAMKRMQENGYDFDSYKPLTEGYRFFWNSEANKVVLAQAQVNEKDETVYVITYPADLADTEFDTALYKALYRDTVVTRASYETIRDALAEARKTENKTLSVQSGNALAAVAAVVNGDYTDADDLSDITVEISGTVDLSTQIWIPIGEAESAPFRGKLIGAEDSVIKGLSSDGYNASIANATKLMSGQIGVSYGLIGFAENATIENITLTNVNIDLPTSAQETGALVGYATGNLTVEDCTVGAAGDGSVVSGQTKMGGLIGTIKQKTGETSSVVTIRNCVNYAAVTATAPSADPNNPRAAGIVGALQANGATYRLENCENHGAITAVSPIAPSVTNPDNAPVAGGIAGQFTVGKVVKDPAGDEYTVLFKDCVNTGELTSRGAGQTGYCDPMLGQINGFNYLIVVNNCKDGENAIAAAPSSLAAESGQAIKHTYAEKVYLKIISDSQTSLYIVKGASGTEKNWEAVEE